MKYGFPVLVALVFLLPLSLLLLSRGGLSDPAEAPKDYATMSTRELIQECTTDMATQYHVHSHLTVIANKETLTVPAEVGIKNGCMSSLHTHNNSGIIHVESPVKRDFTLGDFFYNWDEPLSKDQVLNFKVDETHGLKMFVDGKESTDFENLILSDEQEIVLDYYALADGPDALPEPFNFKEENL